MEQSPSQKQLAEHMRKLSQLYRDVSDQSITREEAATRLSALKAEQKQLRDSGIIPLNMRVSAPPTGQGDDDMMRRFKRARRSYHAPEHELDFKCQCSSCVRKHTITMADRDLLREMKISWGKTSTETENS
jgi:hypothetical protein